MAAEADDRAGGGSSVKALVALAIAALVAGGFLLFGSDEAPRDAEPISAPPSPRSADFLSTPFFIERFDVDADRRISRQEFTFFDHLDLDGDGFVDEEEAWGAVPSRRGTGGPGGNGAGGGRRGDLGQGRGGQARGGQARGEQAGGGWMGKAVSGTGIPALDLDGDGKLSPAEFPGPAMAFEAIDTNSDGLLDTEEMLARDMSRAGQNPWEGRWPRGATESPEDGIMEWSSDDDTVAPPWP